MCLPIIAVGLFRLAAQIGLLSPSGGSLVVNNFALTLAVSVVAACVCWLLMPIVVAGVLGPLVAGLIFCLLALYTYVVDPTGTSVADLLTMSGIYIAFAYFEGGPIALLAGLLVSIWMIRRPPGLVVAVAAAIIAVGLFRLAAQIGLLSPSGGSPERRQSGGQQLCADARGVRRCCLRVLAADASVCYDGMTAAYRSRRAGVRGDSAG